MLEFTKIHKYFNQLSMISKSIAKEPTRYALDNIEVNDKHIVATDGKRLACLDNFGIDSGRYKVTKCTKSLIQWFPVEPEGNFPKYEDIIPEAPREDEKQLIKEASSPYHKPKEGKTTILAYDIAQHKTLVYMPYLVEYQDCESFYVTSPDRPVQFFAESFVGIIMPTNAN